MLPSLDVTWARAQLPAKLMDAMMQGRVVVASDIAPIRWALGEPELLVPPGDVAALVDTLRRLADPSERARYAAALRSRAETHFSVGAHAAPFARLITAAVDAAAGTDHSETGTPGIEHSNTGTAGVNDDQHVVDGISS